jgi:xanthine dehydrogenase/oxidase
MAFGGMAPTTILATNSAKALIGKELNDKTLEQAYDLLVSEIPLQPGAPGGMIQFRRSLTLGFFLKFYLSVQQALQNAIPEVDKSATRQFHSLPTKSAQYFEVVPEGQALHDLVGRNVPHLSAAKQATGVNKSCHIFLQMNIYCFVQVRLFTVTTSPMLQMSCTLPLY